MAALRRDAPGMAGTQPGARAVKLCFVVVGRPNKGKSSIVATLAQNEHVPISPRSGTTTRSEVYEVTVGTDSFVMVDTPGFQRPGKVLAWLQARAAGQGAGADRRATIIEDFLDDPVNRQTFPDEIDVLESIMRRSAPREESVAIIYTVDGSIPYDPAYEAEMAILQWTSKPSIAIINPIAGERYLGQWRAALNHFFKLVRVFNPHYDDARARIQLLEDFSHVDPAWKAPLARIVEAIGEQLSDQARRSAEIAADMLAELCRFSIRQKAPGKAGAESLRPLLEAAFFDRLRARERAALDALQRLYRHGAAERIDVELVLADDLFDTRQWAFWGLSRRKLAIAGAAAGAVAGAGADALSAGLSLGTAAAAGALVGGTGAWLGADKLASLTIRGLPAGGYEAQQGPIRNPNFPYVLLGRFLSVQQALRHRSHARRDALRMEDAHRLDAGIDALGEQQRKRLQRALAALSRQKEVEDLSGALLPLFEAS